jgi:hypothetical protein
MAKNGWLRSTEPGSKHTKYYTMTFAYLTLITALVISLTAAVYSILGLTAIFAAAFWPIVIMGGSLEVGKIVATLWLHKYWHRAELQYKAYLCVAVAILMMLTSMGVFGFLSKAHGDQSLVSGDASAKISIYDEKIKISRENIDANRRALKQMDEAVDQVMGRSTDEKGADKAVAIRRGQTAERGRLLKEIEAEQKKITKLNEERAPIAAENRKIEAEVGPVKYIAALIYGDNPEANVLERAVRWVIILIVIVFDPLALTLLLAATKAIEWERGINIFVPKKRDEDKDTEFDNQDNLDDINKALKDAEEPVDNSKTLFSGFPGSWMFNPQPKEEQKEEPKYEQDDGPLTNEQIKQIVEMAQEELPIGNVISKSSLFPEPPTDNPLDRVLAEVERKHSLDDEPEGTEQHKQIMRAWKEANPNETFKKYRLMKQAGEIDTLPWDNDSFASMFILNEKELANYKKDLELVADNVPPVLSTVTGFGTVLPDEASKGDLFLRIDKLPTVLYKYNGSGWIAVDKNSTDSYVYDDAYIDYLIERIGSGQYDPDLLSDAEREQIAIKLTNQG